LSESHDIVGDVLRYISKYQKFLQQFLRKVKPDANKPLRVYCKNECEEKLKLTFQVMFFLSFVVLLKDALLKIKVRKGGFHSDGIEEPFFLIVKNI